MPSPGGGPRRSTATSCPASYTNSTSRTHGSGSRTYDVAAAIRGAGDAGMFTGRRVDRGARQNRSWSAADVHCCTQQEAGYGAGMKIHRRRGFRPRSRRIGHHERRADHRGGACGHAGGEAGDPAERAVRGARLLQTQREQDFARAAPARRHPTAALSSSLAAELGVRVPVSVFEQAGPDVLQLESR